MEAQDHPDYPSWVETIDFAGMKLKLIGFYGGDLLDTSA